MNELIGDVEEIQQLGSKTLKETELLNKLVKDTNTKLRGVQIPFLMDQTFSK